MCSTPWELSLNYPHEKSLEHVRSQFSISVRANTENLVNLLELMKHTHA